MCKHSLMLFLFSCSVMSDSLRPHVAHQALSMGFSRQGNWSWLPFPASEDLPEPGIKPLSPALAGGFFTTESPRKPKPPLTFKQIHCFTSLMIFPQLTVLLHVMSSTVFVLSRVLVTGQLTGHLFVNPIWPFTCNIRIWVVLSRVVEMCLNNQEMQEPVCQDCSKQVTSWLLNFIFSVVSSQKKKAGWNSPDNPVVRAPPFHYSVSSRWQSRRMCAHLLLRKLQDYNLLLNNH